MFSRFFCDRASYLFLAESEKVKCITPVVRVFVMVNAQSDVSLRTVFNLVTKGFLCSQQCIY